MGSIQRTREGYVLERAQHVAAPLDEVFAFFSAPANLEALTPARLEFAILTPQPIAMRAGTLIEYRLSLWGVPFRWSTRIDAFEPTRRFVDVQIAGPYAKWVHEHRFEELGAGGGTRIVDRVEYAIGWGPLGRIAHAAFVARSLEAIFDYRRERIAERFDRNVVAR